MAAEYVPSCMTVLDGRKYGLANKYPVSHKRAGYFITDQYLSNTRGMKDQDETLIIID